MAQGGKDQTAQSLGEEHNSDSDLATVCQPLSVKPGDVLSEKNAQCKIAGQNINQSERKHRSEPLPEYVNPDDEGRKCFERRRLWKSSKQESFDLPEELNGPTEDNVFAEAGRSRQKSNGRPCYRRSFSVPAMLPDIVPEQTVVPGPENNSPDIVSFRENPKLDLPESTSSPVGLEFMMEEKEKKQHFEGTVHCELPFMSEDVKRKKSVTFETAVQMVRIMSARGVQARSHFRSSGYGSQSDTSQASQGSNMSSERGSIFSDDVLLEKKSLDAYDPLQAFHSSLGSTIVDGNIDDNEEESGITSKTQENLTSLNTENSQLVTSSCKPPFQTSKPQTPEEIDEIELWSQQNVPSFHYGNMDDIPNLSIFEMTKENSGGFYPDTQSGDLTYAAQYGAENADQNPGSGAQQNLSLLHTLQSVEKAPHTFQYRRDSRNLEGESSENKSSPTTKEECQRELYKRLFEERMLKFDPSKENISDLFEWVKKNIGEALTPSPKSPFFTTDRSSQNENIRISPGLAAVTNALQGAGKSSGITRNPPAPSHHPTGFQFVAPYQVTQNPLPVLHTNIQGGRPGLAPGSIVQGMPLSHNPSSSRPIHPWLHPQQRQLQQQQQQQKQQQQCQQPFRPPTDHRDGSGGGPGKMEGVVDQRNPPPVRYQQDLPAILDDVMSSICISSSSDLSASLRPSYVEQLVHVSQCSYVRCTDTVCVQGKKSLCRLQEALKRGPSHLGAEDLDMLNLLNEHYNNCELPHCPVPWCRYLSHLYLPKEGKAPQTLMKLFSDPLLTLLPSKCQFDLFVKFDRSLPGESMPREWEDWLMLYPLSHSYTVARVTPLLPVWPHKHWVVKMADLHEERNQLEVYRKLLDLQNPHIINHIWMAASYSSEILVVCTEFMPGISVRDLLDQQVCLSTHQTCRYWLQILSVAQHLHTLNIAFLNWTCGNLLLDNNNQTVKLTNFVASVELSSGNIDKGGIKLTLPADIVPAELLVQGGELTHKTDSWGLACILHEMLTGTRPWYHLRHCRPEETWPQILKQIPPSITTDLPSFTQLTIQHCLQKSPDSRPSVTDMMDHCHSQWL